MHLWSCRVRMIGILQTPQNSPMFRFGCFLPIVGSLRPCSIQLTGWKPKRTEEPRRATSLNVTTQAAHWVSWMPPRRVRTAASRVRVSRCQTIPGDVNFAKTRPPPKNISKKEGPKWMVPINHLFVPHLGSLHRDETGGVRNSRMIFVLLNH